MIRPFSLVLTILTAMAPLHATAQDTEDREQVMATLTCPLDGQVVEVVDAGACSFSGQTMDGRPLTDCPKERERATLIPDCTQSGLPLYKTFDRQELETLAPILESDLFALIREDSRFARAFYLERKLRPNGPHNLALFILLDAYRDDPSVADSAMMSRLEATAKRMAKAQPEDPATLLALSNTAAWHAYAGRTDEAREWLGELGVIGATARGAAFLNLDMLRSQDTPNEDAIANAERAYRAVRDFSLYGEMLEECLDDLTREGCRADDPFVN